MDALREIIEEHDAVTLLSVAIAAACVLATIWFMLPGGGSGGAGKEEEKTPQAAASATSPPSPNPSSASAAASAAAGPARYDPSVPVSALRCHDVFEWGQNDVIGESPRRSGRTALFFFPITLSSFT
jgi:hypothetical protein